MTERIIDNQIRLIPYYRNDAVSLPWYRDRDVCKQVDNRDTAKLYFIHYSTPCKAMNEFGKWGCNSTNLNRKFFFVDFIYSP